MIDSVAKAHEWAQDWIAAEHNPLGGTRLRACPAANARKFRRMAADERTNAILCGERLPDARARHIAAAAVLEEYAIEADARAVVRDALFAEAERNERERKRAGRRIPAWLRGEEDTRRGLFDDLF